MITFTKQVVYQGRRWIEIHQDGKRVGTLIKWNSGKLARQKPFWMATEMVKKLGAPPFSEGTLTEVKQASIERFSSPYRQMKKLREMVASAIAKEIKYLLSCKGATNPQIIEMRNRTAGMLDAFEAVQIALQGDYTILRTFTKESNHVKDTPE